MPFAYREVERASCLVRSCRGFVARVVQIGILLFMVSPAIFALDRDRLITQFHHTAWTAKDGAPSQIRDITQTKDGYLWIASSQGLDRFDGIKFERYEPRSGGPLPSNNVRALLATNDGGLWISYLNGGVSFLKNGEITNYGEEQGLPSGKIAQMAADADGRIWAAGQDGLILFDGSRWQRIGAEWNFPGKSAASIFVDDSGTIWVATEKTIVFLPRGTNSFLPTEIAVDQVAAMIEAPDKTLWMSETAKSVRPVPLAGIDLKQVGPEVKVGSMDLLFDRDGVLWITSIGDGIRRIPYPDLLRGKSIEQFGMDAEIFSSKDGLTDDYVRPVFEDREGNIWVGTSGGLDRFREADIVPVFFPAGYQNFSLATGEKGEVWAASNRAMCLINATGVIDLEAGPIVQNLFRDDLGGIWGTDATPDSNLRPGLHHLERGRQVRTEPFPDVTAYHILAISKDSDSKLWVYRDPGGLLFLKDKVWTAYDRNSELPQTRPISMFIDSEDRMWLAYPRNTIVMIDGPRLKSFSAESGLDVGDVKVIAGNAGAIWVGGEAGLAVFKSDRFYSIAGGAGPFRSISGIVEGSDGSLWLNEARGIVRIPNDEVRLALIDLDHGHKVANRIFDFLDGLPGTTQQNPPFPTAIEASDGKVWFSTSKGVVWIDPKRISRAPSQPPVSIESITANDQTYYRSFGLELPKGTSSFRIDYTGLNLAMPERTRFRYRLEGADDDWREVGTRREAYYTNLGPGSYRFQVIASNSDGVWADSGDVIEFKILPMFYQTSWFLFLCFVALAFLAWVLYRLRVGQLQARMQAQFAERLSERTRLAQDLHDTLLQGVVSAAMQLDVATERAGESSPAKPMLDRINVLMSDVIADGRNALKGLRSPTISYLSDLERRFSAIKDKLDIEGLTEFRTIVVGSPRPLRSVVGEETFQISREALTNAFRHSGGTVIEVEIEYKPRQFRIVVRDNGRGIAPDIAQSGREGHWGLSGMRERANDIGARLKVYSRAEGGTEVELSLPSRLAFETYVGKGFFGRFRKNGYRRWESAKENLHQ